MLAERSASVHAKVVIVAMTEHEGIQLAWVNCQKTGVVVEGLGRETKIH